MAALADEEEGGLGGLERVASEAANASGDFFPFVADGFLDVLEDCAWSGASIDDADELFLDGAGSGSPEAEDSALTATFDVDPEVPCGVCRLRRLRDAPC